jgi:two-component system response regulator FixJ
MVRKIIAASIPDISSRRGPLHRSEGRGITQETKKGRLVLIEPDASVRDALTLLLQERGWTVLLVDDCDQLLEAIDRSGLTAVISESTLADCTPQDILERCSERGLPVVFTGHDLPVQGAVDLIRQGAVDFLDKPFPQSRLLDLLERLFRGQNGSSAPQS